MSEQLFLKWRSFNGPRAVMFGYEKDPVDYAIEIVSPIHWHTELQFANHQQVSFSTTLRENEGKCARFKKIGYSTPAFWDTVYIPVTEEQEELAWDEACALEGIPYDLIGAAGLLSKRRIIKPHPDKAWCNEICGYVVIAAKGDCFFGHRPDTLSPTEADFLLRHMFRQDGV